MKQKTQSSAAKTNGDAITLPDNAARGQKQHSRRSGPQPLNMHLYTTAFLMSAAAWPWAQDPEYRQKVLDVLSNLSDDMKRGIEAYKDAVVSANRVQQDVIWKKGSSSLLRYPSGKQGEKTPVLLVPSLINKADVLDLDEGHSFTQYLVAEGFDVYTMDWGIPADQEKTFSINEYITDRLIPALEIMNKETGQATHVIGYCMGGTIAAGALAVLDEQKTYAQSLTMLAAPWDFQADDKNVALRMNAYLSSAEAVMIAKGALPVDWIQMLFASIDPLFAFNKFRDFADMDKTSAEARRFVIVEDWLNDGMDLTAPAARQALQEWYIDNQPVNGVWSIGPKLVDQNNISIPVLVVAATGDRLVPEASARAFMQGAGNVTTISPEIGHIGMMASNRAVAEVWQPVTSWLKSQ